tara:strand:- start:1541 stop:2329 length:789 start_codon:yes stop_codon:yes gene_type:complete
MREEEKLARDVYSHMFNVWGSQVFGSIAASEQRHMDAVLSLLNTYGIPDPASGNSAGIFDNTALQKLYDTLIQVGAVSELDAMQVGITIEETDIADLNLAIETTAKSNVVRVYNNLLKGSLNHLAAFTNNLEALGGVPSSETQNGNSLAPGTSIYEPISQTLYIPALDLISETNETVVYDVLLRLVETLPQALEVVSVTETNKLPSDDHASYDSSTLILEIPDLSFGALTLTETNSFYSLTARLVEDTEGAIIFVVTELHVK